MTKMTNTMHLLRLVACLGLFLVAINNGPPSCLGLVVPPGIFRQKKRGTTSSSASAESDKEGNDIISKKKKKQQHDQAVLLLNIISLTGKQEYEFGDLARWLDKRARDKVQDLASKNHHHSNVSKTENLSRFRYLVKYPYLNLLIKQPKVVLLVWVVRIVMVFQWEAYVLKYLPDIILIEIVHQCLSNASVRPKILRVVSTEMDHRIHSLVENYQFGDITRGTIQNVKLSRQALLKLTGQEQKYVFGDISKQILKEALERQRKEGDRTTEANSRKAFMTQNLIQRQIDFIEQMQNQSRKELKTSQNSRRRFLSTFNASKRPNAL